MKNKYLVSYWVEEKSYDDRPCSEYEESVIVLAESEDEALIKVPTSKQVGKYRYNFKVSKVK